MTSNDFMESATAIFCGKKNVISKLTKGTPEIMIAEYSMLA